MSTASHQVVRLLALAPYLQSHGPVPVDLLAEEFTVSPAQIVKDLKVLWMCGLPGLTPDRMIEIDMEAVESGPDGVVKIRNADFLDRPLRLGSTEASALIVALRALREMGTAASHEVVDRVLAKMEDAAATGPLSPTAVAVHLPAPDQTGAVQSALQAAISRDRQVHLSYYVPTRDERTERVVDPVAVLTHDGAEYLDAWCHLAQGRRLFRLDRVHEARTLENPRERQTLPPRDLSEGLFEPGKEARLATVRLAAPIRWMVEYYPVERVEELSDGGLRCDLRVADPRWLIQLCLRFAPDLEVEEPVELREAVRDAARETLRLYEVPEDFGPGA